MVKNITSINQRNGITANTININKSVENNNNGFWKNPWVIGFITGLIIFGIGIMVDKKGINEEGVTVTSINQQGGITANNVNLGNPQRMLTTKFSSDLDNKLKQLGAKGIYIFHVSGDSESYNYANQINDYLISNGWTSEVGSTIFENPEPFGAYLVPELDEEGYATMVVGHFKA